MLRRIVNWLSAIFLFCLPWPQMGWIVAGVLLIVVGALIILWQWN